MKIVFPLGFLSPRGSKRYQVLHVALFLFDVIQCILDLLSFGLLHLARFLFTEGQKVVQITSGVVPQGLVSLLEFVDDVLKSVEFVDRSCDVHLLKGLCKETTD